MFIPPSAWFTGFIPDLPTPFDTEQLALQGVTRLGD